MMLRRWLSLGCLAFALSLAPSRASAQLAPTGGHYGGRPSDTGFQGGVSSSGGYQAAVPLDLPGARGGLPVPVQVVYTKGGFGAAGLGWDVPLSYLRDDTTFARRRPKAISGAAPQAREQVFVILDGSRIDLVRTATAWVARNTPGVEVRQQGDGTWVLFDAMGRTYLFSSPSAALGGTGISLLTDITGVGGSKVHLDYTITTPPSPGNVAVTVDLTTVSYNPSPSTTGCFKNTVDLAYDAPGTASLSRSVVGSKLLERRHKLTGISASGKSVCGASGELIRSYQFAYQTDADTGQSQLQSVKVTGRAGTPEASTPLPVATYSYGAASSGGQLNYVLAGAPALGFTTLGNTVSSGTPTSDGAVVGWSSTVTLADITGDGRPDLIGFAPSTTQLQVQRNNSGPGQAAFSGAGSLSDGVLTARAIETRDLQQFRYGPSPGSNDQLWRQAIDFNGDGRLDIVDAHEQGGHWVIYLNTPDPANPATIHWVRRSISIGSLATQLAIRGFVNFGPYLPLARRATYRNSYSSKCYIFLGSAWVVATKQSLCGQPSFPPVVETTITEWEILDVNGDGYPDVVFNSAPVTTVTLQSPLPEDGNDGDLYTAVITKTQKLSGATDRIDAMLNVVGNRLTDGDDQPFSAPIVLRNNDDCGVEQWQSSQQTSFGTQELACGLQDVNGDGLVDRVSVLSVFLGTGIPSADGIFTAGAMLTLPEILSIQQSGEFSACKSGIPGNTFGAGTSAGLRDLTGDGIPDYVSMNGFGAWSVYAGTGVGFAAAKPIIGTFAISTATENCGANFATTTAGLFDIDGDGKADPVMNSQLYQLSGSSGIIGAPDAGRLIGIDNGYGAQTSIHYRSIKADPGLHQVPFPEIVVDSVDTTGTKGFGGSLLATRYAYAGAELSFDAAADAFTFRGYRRVIELPTPVGQPSGVATLTITDSYAPVSAVDPYGITDGAVLDAAQRYNLDLRAGRTRDVTTLSGDFGAAAITAPRLLLTLDVASDPRRIAVTHHDWGSRPLAATSDPPGPEPCTEIVSPYDYAASTAYASSHAGYDPCKAHGFAYGASVQSWRGAPGAAPPSTSNVETRTDVVTVDDLGRALSVKQFNDVHRDDDDLCIDTTFAEPTGANERVLLAPAARAVSGCGTAIYAKESFEYDGLSTGSVSSGLVTAHTVERRSDAGTLLGTIRQFDAGYDAAGNPSVVTTTREDGAKRTVGASYDVFGLAPTTITVTSPTAPALQTSISRDPVTLAAQTTTDPNGTQHGAKFDGFQRGTQATLTPPGGAVGVLSTVSYLGFSGTDSLGRRVVRKVFADSVAPGTETTALGRTSTVFLDELGRPRRSELGLGANYGDQTLVVGSRVYDGLGRVFTEADPFPVAPGQTPPAAYGTTYYFNADGSPSCMVRGTGQQPFTSTSNEASEIFPTCFDRTFENNTEVVSVQDAASLLAGSTQFGVKSTSYATAIGRTIMHSSWQASSRIEHAMFGYDRLGHRISMTRYRDAAGGTKPVQSSWRFDSLGQVLELDEPDSAPQFRTFSNWGELTSVKRNSFGSISTLWARSTYDAYSRLVHQEQSRDTAVDADTIMNYQYDAGVNLAPQVTPTNVLGRLAQASSPTGTASFSYDAFGRINARVFTDNRGALYVEKHTAHDDGSPKFLDLFLPDTGYADEQVSYTYDSAGRGLSVKYANGADVADLYEASTIDALGRVRQAKYGQTTYAASYADVGRQLLTQVTVSSPLGARALNFPSYDPLGRERSRSEVKNGSGSAVTTTSNYDPLGQLSHAVQVAATRTLFDQRFTYDPLGNILSISDAAVSSSASTTTLSYLDTDRDRVCHIAYGSDNTTGCNVAYDEVGNIVSQKTATGTRQYNYYIDGSIRTITDDKGSEAHFRYDAFGEVQELDLTSSTSLDTRRDRRYGGLIAWSDVITGMSHTSVLSRTIPGPDGFSATRRGPGGPWLFTFGEARGSRFSTDQNGAFVQDVDYQPYGTPRSTGAQPGSLLYSNEQWNGGDALAAFGISHLGARLYDPAIGRFLSRDPLLIPRTAATTNPYAFAMNDPVNSSDPSGLDNLPETDDGTVHLEDGAKRGGSGMPSSGKSDNSTPGNGTSGHGTVSAGIEIHSSRGEHNPMDAAERQTHGKSHSGGSTDQAASPAAGGGFIQVVNGIPLYYRGDGSIEFLSDSTESGDPGLETFVGTRIPSNSSSKRLAPRRYYTNSQAAQLAANGFVHMAELAEAGHGCAFCHVQHNFNRLLRDDELDMDHYFLVSGTLAAGRMMTEGMLGESAASTSMSRPTCFAAGTLVAVADGETAIERLKLGDRVEAGNPQCASEHLDVDAFAIGLELRDSREPHILYRIEVARSLAWLVAHRWNGNEIQFDLPELGATGYATVTQILPLQEQPGSGCLVTMTVEHVADRVLKLKLETGTELEVTPPHRLWVEDVSTGGGWMPAAELRPEMLLRGDNAPVRILSVTSGAPNQRVFNLEVGLEHTYRVTTDRIWAHNNCEIPRFTPQMKSQARVIATGKGIDKVEQLVEKFGGTTKNWRKMKTRDGLGREIHYYEHPGIGVRGAKWAGDFDPF